MKRIALLFALLITVPISACLASTDHVGPWHCAADKDCEDGTICLARYGAYERICALPGSCERDRDCEGASGEWLGKSCVAGRCAIVEAGASAASDQ